MVMPRSRSISIESSTCSVHLALLEAAGELDQPVGERRLAVVDMRDDREIADVLDGEGGVAGRDSNAASGGGQSHQFQLMRRGPPIAAAQGLLGPACAGHDIRGCTGHGLPRMRRAEVRRRAAYCAATRCSTAEGSSRAGLPACATTMWPGGTGFQFARSVVERLGDDHDVVAGLAVIERVGVVVGGVAEGVEIAAVGERGGEAQRLR